MQGIERGIRFFANAMAAFPVGLRGVLIMSGMVFGGFLFYAYLCCTAAKY
jgi:hypothetical protein